MKKVTQINSVPENDAERVRILQRYKILNTPSEKAFDSIVALTANIFQVPIALISIIDVNKVFLKANIGMGKVKSTPRKNSLCSFAILSPEITVFEDALKEPCLLANPVITGKLGLKFYAGAPIISHDGFTIGTLCIIDKKPREFSEQNASVLKNLATIVMEQIELRLSAIEEVNKQVESNIEVALSNKELAATQDELRRTVSELSESEVRTQAAIAVARMGIWSVEPLSKKVIFSAQSQKLHGLPNDFILTIDRVILLIDPEHRERVSNSLNKSLENNENFNEEYLIHPMNGGGAKWLKSSGKNCFTKNGELLNFTGTITDITEQKSDEQRKNDFITMVSHEIKTPLTSLKAYIQILSKKFIANEDPFTRDILFKAYSQAKKMGAIITGFLNVSTTESGQIQLDKEHFDLEKLIKEEIEELTLISSSHNIIFTMTQPIMVFCDRVKIGQAVNNFLTNAVKYSPYGKEIYVNARTTADTVQVSVKDEGLGIIQSDINRLFERFYRVTNVTTQSISGFGIGLYLCKEIINKHEGNVWVESELGKGSVFYFSLPMAS